MRPGALVVFALLVTGCTAPPAPAPDEAAPPASPVVEAPVALALAPPDRVVRAPLDVALALSERWIKPLRPLDVAVEAPPAATVAWFVELDGEEPRATLLDGDLFVLKASTPDHHNTEGPRASVIVPPIEADGRARSVRVERAGRYTFEGEGARLVVSAWPGAPESAAQAFLVEEAGALRFEPPEVHVEPGSRVLVWSQSPRALEIRETRFAAYVPLGAREGRITPIDEGLWRIVALAVADDDARGVASAPFLVDFERPSDRLVVGPFFGDLTAPESGLEDARRVSFRAEHPLESLRIAFAARSNVPALPASIVVRLFRGDELLAESSSLTAGEIVLEDLPAEKYTLEVEGEHGAFVGYEVAGEGAYRLPTPDRLREATR